MLERSARISSAFDAAAWTTNAETFRCDAAAARSSSSLVRGIDPDLKPFFLDR